MGFKIKPLLPIVLPIIITLVVSNYLQYEVMSNQIEFTTWLSHFGSYIILIYIVLQAITIIIAPIGGFFLTLTMIILFGETYAFIIGYLVSTPIYLINFYLARRYGRPLVLKILGQSSVEKLDHLVKDAGILILIMTRVLQSPNFDYLSYGWGLTKIPFKTFVLINFIAGIPGTFISYLIFSQFDNLFFGLLAFYISTGILAGLAIYLTHILKKHNQF